MNWVTRARPKTDRLREQADVEIDDLRPLERGMFVYDAPYAWCRRRENQREPFRPL
jgi:hypothetical protein